MARPLLLLLVVVRMVAAHAQPQMALLPPLPLLPQLHLLLLHHPSGSSLPASPRALVHPRLPLEASRVQMQQPLALPVVRLLPLHLLVPSWSSHQTLLPLRLLPPLRVPLPPPRPLARLPSRLVVQSHLVLPSSPSSQVALLLLLACLLVASWVSALASALLQ